MQIHFTDSLGEATKPSSSNGRPPGLELPCPIEAVTCRHHISRYEHFQKQQDPCSMHACTGQHSSYCLGLAYHSPADSAHVPCCCHHASATHDEEGGCCEPEHTQNWAARCSADGGFKNSSLTLDQHPGSL